MLGTDIELRKQENVVSYEAPNRVKEMDNDGGSLTKCRDLKGWRGGGAQKVLWRQGYVSLSMQGYIEMC